MTKTSPSRDDSSTFSLKAATGLIFFLFGLFLIVLTFSILREQAETQKRTEDRALAASQVVATNARWIVELSRQALGRVDEALGPDINSRAAETGALIREAIASLPGDAKATVVSAEGRTVFSTDPGGTLLDPSQGEYFASLASGTTWYASSLMLENDGATQIFSFSKRLERNGEFVGVAVLSFDVGLFKEIWEAVELDEISTVSLVRSDGQLVARYPFAKGPVDLSNYVLFTEHLKRAETGTYEAARSPVDGYRRIVGYRRVPATDFVALASVNKDAAFASFRRNTLLTLAFALPTALALLGAIVWILRLLRDDQRRRLQLAEALELNRMLVMDTHHRVKNNLQSVVSLIRMHALPERLKADLQTRIFAMAAVHEHLYRLDQFAEVEAKTLIPAIVEPLKQGFDNQVTIAYDVDPFILDRDHATPLALLVNEAVTNALKYAFPGSGAGRIVIALKQTGSREFILSISDDGVGFDPAADRQGLGTRLMRAMVAQLHGTWEYDFDHGTRFEAKLNLGTA
ncbi:two-component sensor histidine kinase [Rhodoligotrophos appendicifer]|uniref:sensor histidine kinase n=1 Tax=Rhodoligotrophos appendicifer TaxID=987056 RepID=UPI0011848443|nr:cache domain-containing protein [Rhodoligotrophos appendicifer]